MESRTSFMVYCLERYRYYHGLSGREASGLFWENGVFAYLDEFYGALHTMGERYIIQDIDEFLSGRGSPL